MAEQVNSKDLISVLWSGADILRSKMDANEYKDYLLGIVFYKYLSDSFLIKAYDLIYDEKPETLKIALDALKDESAEEQKLSSPLVRKKKIGRNDLCPCGSGKKSKGRRILFMACKLHYDQPTESNRMYE